MSILLGNGDGTFTTGSTQSVGQGPGAMVTADFNGDGIPDLATANSDDGTLSVLLGNGDGTFSNASNLSVGGQPRSLAIGDFNGDGIPDLTTEDFNGDTVVVLIGKGDGTFTVGPALKVGVGPWTVAVGDFNGDGVPDLATANYDNTVSILLGAVATTAIANHVTVPGGGTHHVYAQYPGDAEHSGSTSTTWSVQGSAVKAATATAR